MKRLFYAERCASCVQKYRGKLLVRAEARYPEFTAVEFLPSIREVNAEYARRARVAVRAFVLEYREEAERTFMSRPAGGFSPFEFLQTFCITLLGGRLVSLYFDAYRYLGGAHGGTVRASDTFITKTGERLSLAEFFSPGAPYEERILANVVSSIEERRSEDPSAFFENSSELARAAFHPANYYLSPGTLNVYFQQYDIAPYATGIPVFSIELCAIGATAEYL